MDIFIPIVICVIFFVLFSFCGYCCNKHRGHVYGYNTAPAITVTTSHATAHAVAQQPSYPVAPYQHITQPMPAPAPGFMPGGGYQSTPYPPGPGFYYPPPMAVGMAPGGPPYPIGITPYPPVSPYPPDQAPPPPTYREAVGQPPVLPAPTTEHYSKQAPYNPNY